MTKEEKAILEAAKVAQAAAEAQEEKTVREVKIKIRALDPNNIVPAGFLKTGEYNAHFKADSDFETKVSGKGKEYKIINCEFTDSQGNTTKGSISEYQLPAFMKNGKLVLGDSMGISVTREPGATFADITLLTIGMPVMIVKFDEE